MTTHARMFALTILALAVRTAGAGVPVPAGHVHVPAIFGDHMVLQQHCAVPVWGTGEPGGRVCVALDGRPARITTAGADGRWSLRLAPMPAGGPHVLRVWGRDTLVLRDVMVGEVWLASGQSNMEMPVDGWGKVLGADAEVATADHPDIRMLTIERRIAFAPERDIRTAGWQVCSPRTVRAFSASAYFFARTLHDSLHVPVGILHASWGGTEIEAWTRTGALARLPGMVEPLRRAAARAAAGPLEAQRAEFARAGAAWLAAVPRADRGSQGDPHWASPALDDGDWKTMSLPTDWENAGFPDLDGVVWFRRHVTVPAAWSGRALALGLGRIDDADTTYFDGVPVGTDSVYDRPREYVVPARLVTPGEHVIAVRVYDWGGGGGLWGEAWRMRLGAGARDSIALAGDWRFRVGLDFASLPPRPRDPDDPNLPGVLANGMIAPLVPYALRGAIWYQGEANAPRAEQYRALLPGLIADWRAWWGAGDFPFLFVQLAGFGEPSPEPGENDWAELREAQALALRTPHTGMATAIDIGEARDIHPRDKQDVGRRLALAALEVAYRRPLTGGGPRFHDVRFEGPAARVRFLRTGGALRARGALRGFALAGADRRFHWASAVIEGDAVVLTCDAVPHPVAVRYAWAAFPECGLEGATGLPAEPFRSDDWPGVTHGKY